MSIFFGQQNNEHIKLIDSVQMDNNWFIVDRYNTTQFCAVTLSNRLPPSPTLAKNEATNIICLADAYISNKKELFNQLAIGEKTGTLWSDTQIILASYQRWGIDCVHKLRGDFAFVIWDLKAQQLFLVRDPMGYRSLFYHISNKGDIFFANTVKLIIEQFNVSKEINRQKAATFLTLLIEDGDMTFYKYISKVPAGFYLHCSTQKAPQLKRYWDAEQFVEDPIIFKQREDYYHHFRDLFKEVVNAYIPATGNVASHLSGGLDSSSVSAIAAGLLKKENRMLTTLGHIPFHQKATSPLEQWSYCDQTCMEAFTNEYKNSRHYYIKPQEYTSFSLRFKTWLDQPAINPCNMPWLFGCSTQAHELGISTILTGQGGNVTISWPNKPIKKTVWTLRNTLSSIKQSCHEKFQRQPWQSFSAIHPELARNTNLFYSYTKEEHLYTSDARPFYFNNNMMDYASSIYLPMRSLYHINHFDPTLDTRIVEFCLRLPLEICQDKERSRLLVREGLSDALPKLISERTVRGLQSADWYMLFEQNKSFFYDHLKLWEKNHVAEFIDVKALIKLLTQWDYKKVQQSQERDYKAFVHQYQLKFLRAIEVGLFIQ